MDVPVRSHLSPLSDDQVARIRARWEREKRARVAAPPAATRRRRGTAPAAPGPSEARSRPARERASQASSSRARRTAPEAHVEAAALRSEARFQLLLHNSAGTDCASTPADVQRSSGRDSACPARRQRHRRRRTLVQRTGDRAMTPASVSVRSRWFGCRVASGCYRAHAPPPSRISGSGCWHCPTRREVAQVAVAVVWRGGEDRGGSRKKRKARSRSGSGIGEHR